MKLTFAGVGGAFAPSEYWQSNAVISSDNTDKVFLLDCGGDARHSLRELGLNHRDIEAVYISHLHTDHCGGLEWLGFSTYFDPECSKPIRYIVEDLLAPLWETLRAGMQSHEGVVLELTDFFELVPVQINSCFVWDKCKFCPIQTVHVMNGNGILPSYGLMLTTDDRISFFTTDTQLCPRQIEAFYAKADAIFHDCETYPFRSGVHAHYDDLKTLPEETKAKMWLYHYAPNPPQDVLGDGFCGFVEKGQSFEI